VIFSIPVRSFFKLISFIGLFYTTFNMIYQSVLNSIAQE